MSISDFQGRIPTCVPNFDRPFTQLEPFLIMDSNRIAIVVFYKILTQSKRFIPYPLPPNLVVRKEFLQLQMSCLSVVKEEERLKTRWDSSNALYNTLVVVRRLFLFYAICQWNEKRKILHSASITIKNLNVKWTGGVWSALAQEKLQGWPIRWKVKLYFKKLLR